MVIIEQGHEILKMDDAVLIERAGRTCYKSESKIGCTLKGTACPHKLPVPCGLNIGAVAECEYHSSFAFAEKVLKSGHHSVIEHANATVHFTTDRGVTHELVRHRLCAFSQESTRYCDYNKSGDIQFIKPVWWDDCKNLDEPINPSIVLYEPLDCVTPEKRWIITMIEAEEHYKYLRREGWAPEKARSVLPNSLKTEIVVTANFREWRHILSLRAIGTTGKPHPQMQALMIPLLEEFKNKCPAVFGDLNLKKE